ncbi:MAG: IS605 OrfB-like transposable element containing RNAse H-like and Zn finger domain [Candidatus Methanohalarchaeum thermophilum]|uniref:IS605 OrfB-like transposable element containing RNAse H-like and Zn finger domain n=1 Tax=Methanohalarchaeum thermophilum TaxID=1903181 RepID=A0A1Q6DSG7_METT1|nr:MAG: IS605 OrfB-like transposable element containing RNAse H-like and Zn finger domain [Candidatus Methanohalarchaeum thermophilum]
MNVPNYLKKTVKVKLDVDEDDKDKLLGTFRQFNRSCNKVVEAGWNKSGDKNYNKMELHEETYRDIKDELDLTANLVCSARNRAAEAIKKVVQGWSNGKKASKPQFDKYSSILYDKRSATIKDRYCTLSTVDGRIEAEYVIGEYQKKHLDDKNYEFRSCTLNYERDKDEFYLHITIRKPVLYRNEGNVLGVDLGMKNIAVTSTGKFLGEDMRWQKNHFFRVKKGLQGKGTQSAMRTLKDMAGRENRYTENKLHNISRELVEEAEKHNCKTIAFEDLKEIRDKDEKFNSRLERQLHSWGFEKLQKFTEYKAKEKGVEVVRVKSEYTSQTCSKCGHTEKSNRNGSQFKCKECGYEVNADYNAAKNIGTRALPSDKSSDGLSHGQLALKSGTLNPTAA